MKRRELLLEQMNHLEQMNITCESCTGRCCTYQANSMQITALETEDLYQYLVSSNLWTDLLVSKLKESITEYRLDKEISTGRNSNFRRSYTCPFFKHESLGCPIPPEFKPYGCLAFNADSLGVKDGEDCSSKLGLLEQRESPKEDKENSTLKENYQYHWDKLPIPMALLERDKTSS